MGEQAGNIISHMLKTYGAIREGCAPMSIQIDANHLMVQRERGRNSREHIKGSKATVKHNQWTAITMHLIVQVDPVYRGVFTLWIVRTGCHEHLLLQFPVVRTVYLLHDVSSVRTVCSLIVFYFTREK
jgi:hypothetical protein